LARGRFEVNADCVDLLPPVSGREQQELMARFKIARAKKSMLIAIKMRGVGERRDQRRAGEASPTAPVISRAI
jgi:hypothetical protein